ncbi:hypothetical protein [Paraburkholderia sp. WSM4177]|uniref:hypothetical protein n=1 Tax=unclassified Paraburkholderia TaxID=2615204 RepID=UPI003906792F
MSYTYSTGATGARQALAVANRGQNDEVAIEMARNVYVHPHDCAWLDQIVAEQKLEQVVKGGQGRGVGELQSGDREEAHRVENAP